MDQPATPIVRHDGWTRERQALFLDCLAERGNVRLACTRAGMSPEAAYRLRRRDALFAAITPSTSSTSSALLAAT